MVAELLTQHLGLLTQSDLAMLFSRFNKLVHGLQTLLNLFHQPAFSLQPKSLILLQLVNQIQQSLFDLSFDLLLLS